MRKNFWGFIIATTFFIVGVFTLSDYGINVDEPAHFIRGQAYVQLLLTGEKDYSNEQLNAPRVSVWKFPLYNGYFYLNRDTGHPPLNGILAALTNRIFYEKLGFLGDLESYHLFEVFVSSLLVYLVYIFTAKHYGPFAGVVAALSVGLYPLFLGESHFNIKDPVETSFYAFTIYFFYLGLEKNKGRYFLVSSLFFALAFSTKFNILFLVPTILIYLIIRRPPLGKTPLTVWLSLLVYPVIVLVIYFFTRPYLWADPVGRFLETFQYYKEIGTGSFSDNRFLINGWNSYPLIFVTISTPIVILFYAGAGAVTGLAGLREDKSKFSALILLWLLVPIVRVTLPGTSVYSGVRQIMEYIPAMAILAGMGALTIKNKLANYIGKTVSVFIILVSFTPLVIAVIKLHPNENVFINALAGGLSGAAEKKIPGAGESMGNVYLQGIGWLNENAEEGSHFGLPVGLKSNVPEQFLENGIQIGPYFSGMKRDGEYMIEKVSVGDPLNPDLYNFAYLERFLEPVHEVKVDGVTLLKIWKNDVDHTKQGFLEEKEIKYHLRKNEDGSLRLEFDEPEFLTRLEVDHFSGSCEAKAKGYISYSPDGISEVFSGDLYTLQGPYALSLQTDSRYVYFFAATKAVWIKIAITEANSCLAQVKQMRVYGLK
ncbi:hypothetical protein A2630_02260 [Candidatus Woesebacteria bacterium RIFCSPHIGHO2_01_FULL_44_10]|uniref:Glycosyltransferase RgtA/B/C/D-like domain-containing protein n=1 Tax=Candidatus Woesebacteria bacterium RIFCSPLOWO2_01_FULL_44_14 TaxID=1802525 RepID=A0A1F8C0X6_9BACT|nr:MAG: hypothetical protein A2630_02260 [Candidatus Woesebacteria bacterium RIFCSPHIGHO2_01_FULL_44_10]OGM53954.1 MAG: hypothetical protein A3F62_00080 [Candidatus Woesebacteria bacterium RIFCSPHIGHO2_12_FULL_44_11]OGM69922.1 MAG: hypothetical protein A2975_04920 [Candidatus Woesebacteria bacterium RIFCSPLOWO2_01_FULL_44_14]